MRSFIIFCLVAVADMILTINGIMKGELEEGNFLISGFSRLFGVDIDFCLAIFKIMSVLLAFWLIFFVPKIITDDCHGQKIFFKYFLRPGAMEKIILAICAVYFIFAIAPVCFYNLFAFSFY